MEKKKHLADLVIIWMQSFVDVCVTAWQEAVSPPWNITMGGPYYNYPMQMECGQKQACFKFSLWEVCTEVTQTGRGRERERETGVMEDSTSLDAGYRTQCESCFYQHKASGSVCSIAQTGHINAFVCVCPCCVCLCVFVCVCVCLCVSLSATGLLAGLCGLRATRRWH